MEKVLNSTNDNTQSISIYGDNNQVFQIVLKTNDTVMVNSNYIAYTSSPTLEEVPYYEVNSLLPVENQFDKTQNKIKNKQIIRLKNISNTFEYVGLTKGGKIMKISPLLYNNLYVRIDSLIAFSESIDLFEDSEYQKKIDAHFGKSIQMGRPTFIPQFVLVKPKLQKKNKISVVLKTKDADSIATDLRSILHDYLYLASKKILIEKRLGENEQIIILKNGLVAFEKSVSFYKVCVSQNKNVNYVNSGEDIIIEGPGLVIFEPVKRKIKDMRSFFVFLVPTIFIFLQVVFSLLI